jgi:hypothetical protein
VLANGAWNDGYYGKTTVLPPAILLRKTVQNPKSSPPLSALNRMAK